MIESIDLKGLAASPMFGYAAKLPFFSDKKAVGFKSGLNIVFGPNGSGKSTVINMLAECLLARQAGVSLLSEAAINDGIDMMASLRFGKSPGKMIDQLSLKVRHDGQPLCYVDPRKSNGLRGESLGDDDFFDTGLVETMRGGRMSHGQLAAYRGDAVLKLLLGKLQFPGEIVDRVGRVNDQWETAKSLLLKRLKPSIERGQPTVLMDEPESNFSLVWQAKLWDMLTQPEVVNRFQVIVVTHSPLALGIPGANYIETAPGYLSEVLGLLKKHGERLAVVP